MDDKSTKSEKVGSGTMSQCEESVIAPGESPTREDVAAALDLYLLKTDQHPEYRLAKRRSPREE